MANETVPSAEFLAIPLDLVVATPMLAAMKAQAATADATRMYIERLIDPQTRRPVMVGLNLDFKDDAGEQHSTGVQAPLLSLVPVPHMCIDAVNVQFKYEISQLAKDTRATGLNMELGVNSGAALSPWVDASLRGSVTSQSSVESTMNRSGSLDVTVHASEAPIPEGLAKLLTLLSNAILVSPSGPRAPKPAVPEAAVVPVVPTSPNEPVTL